MQVFNRIIHSFSKRCRLTARTLGIWIVVASLGILIGPLLNMAPAAPEVALTLLNGEKLSTRRLKGTMYIVHFWSINCATCIEEMPQLVKFYEEFKTKGLELIAVAMAYDSPNYVKHYVQNRPLPFKVGIDSGEIAERFGHVQLTPTTFLMDHRGRIVKRYVGPLPFGALAASIVAMTREAN